MNDGEDAKCQDVPASIASAVRDPDAETLTGIVWSELRLGEAHRPFRLPAATGSYESVSSFVETEMMLQAEIMRSNVSDKMRMVKFMPKGETAHRKAEKHLRITLPRNVTGRVLSLDLAYLQREPPRGSFTNYVFVFQKRLASGDAMKNICLAYSKQVQKRNGAIFLLGKDADDSFSDLAAGTTIYARPLVNCSRWKTHIRAIVALKEAEAALASSFVTGQLLSGRIGDQDIKRVRELDAWIRSRISGDGGADSRDLQAFNTQQQRALALDALTSKGLVLIQGPPGTGKSHIICQGILPQAVSRNERVLVVCNSNVAVDALLTKCHHGNNPNLQGTMGRCGFKQSVSGEVVDLGLYLEGDLSATCDEYGNTAGANSNTLDSTVQNQIHSKKIIFATIHFASKDKGGSQSRVSFWDFDVLVLDEAAQIEDARLMIVLARCPSLMKIVLVGDPRQLQPYVPDSLRKQRYGRSTMERVMDAAVEDPGSAPYIMLERQFRMAPPLSSIVSHLYYNNRLQDDESIMKNGPVAEVDLKPLLVVNVTGTEMKYNSMHNSFENKAEAKVVKVVYEFLFGSRFSDKKPLRGEELKAEDVCILTPYNRHKDLLRMEICGVDEDALDSYSGQTFSSRQQTPVKSGSDTRSNYYSSTPLTSPLKKAQAIFGTQDNVGRDTTSRVENIDTVDKFQGSQRKVVMISTCVDKGPRRAADPHFINVACSRAQHLPLLLETSRADCQVIVTGNTFRARQLSVAHILNMRLQFTKATKQT